MEYLILGLLILSPMTGYEVQQFIRKNLALICSHSAGSVQTALSKLEKSGKVASSETVAGKRRKKTFSITVILGQICRKLLILKIPFRIARRSSQCSCSVSSK